MVAESWFNDRATSTKRTGNRSVADERDDNFSMVIFIDFESACKSDESKDYGSFGRCKWNERLPSRQVLCMHDPNCFRTKKIPWPTRRSQVGCNSAIIVLHRKPWMGTHSEHPKLLGKSNPRSCHAQKTIFSMGQLLKTI